LKIPTSLALTRRRAIEVLGLSALSPATMANEATFPSRGLRIIVPYGPGTGSDFVARLLSDKLSEQFKQPVVVDNKAGAGGVIGTQLIATAQPDGYTIGIAAPSTLAMAPATLKDPPYNALTDFEALTTVASIDMVMVSGTQSGATLGEFVTWARQQKKPVFLGTFGAGGAGHFAGHLFGKAAKFEFESVHYRTVGEAVTALIAGDVGFLVATPSLVLPHVKAGKLRALATNGLTRSRAYPDVPTFTEAGYTDMQFSNWVGLVAPAKTPPEILRILHAEIVKATHLPEVRSRLEDSGYRVTTTQQQEMANTIRSDVALWSTVVKSGGFKV
jgi:tripartite-type tricarboxylate transporter receptor subunit TctC